MLYTKLYSKNEVYNGNKTKEGNYGKGNLQKR